MTKINALFLMLVMSVVMVQCTKTGPAGPAGAAGATGATGPVNNVSVQTIVLSNTTFTTGSNTYPIPAITQNILDSGVVVVYVKNTNWSYWLPLPYINGTSAISVLSIQLGAVTLQSNFSGVAVDFKFDIIAAHR